MNTEVELECGMISYDTATGRMFVWSGVQWEEDPLLNQVVQASQPTPMSAIWRLVERDGKVRRKVDRVDTDHKSVNSKKLVGEMSKDIKEAVTSYLNDYGIEELKEHIPAIIEEYIGEKFELYELSQVDAQVTEEQHTEDRWEGNERKVVVKDKIVVRVSFKQKHCINTTKLRFDFILSA